MYIPINRQVRVVSIIMYSQLRREDMTAEEKRKNAKMKSGFANCTKKNMEGEKHFYGNRNDVLRHLGCESPRCFFIAKKAEIGYNLLSLVWYKGYSENGYDV